MRVAIPLKALVQRFALALLLCASVALLVVSKAENAGTESARAALADVVVPILAALGEPVAATQQAIATIDRFFDVYGENQRLRDENARLRQWQDVAHRLEPENARLRRLVSAGVEPQRTFLTARVVAESGGPFVRTLLVYAGLREGVEKGQAVVAEGGFAGRVVEVGQRSARILLLTDLNSRIPVVVEGSWTRAVLSGDNSGRPRLEYLPSSAQVAVGDRVVTSGDDGLLPVGLAIGEVVAVGEGGVRVRPFVDLDRLAFVRFVGFDSPRLNPAELGRSANGL